ncbi:hypothetical protein BGP76_10910 [Reichenbachiella sp. MSK19-1]|nr:hypothetical protein BGP76_10910 [Reichenbachiella sp. MSK19-1]
MFGVVTNRKIILKILLYGLLGYFSYLMILITIQYIPIDFKAAFLGIKQNEIELPYYRLAFFIHVYSSIFTLLIGFFQFSNTIRKRYPRLHRSIGKFYIGTIVILAGPSGLVMGYHANGGIYSQISFCLLSILWIYFSLMAYKYARAKKWTLHKNFIYRSYALTLSAISLRLFKWIIVGTFALPPMDTYQIVSWLGWIVNLGIAEFIIRFRK